MSNVQKRRITKMSEKTLWINKVKANKISKKAFKGKNHRNNQVNTPQWIDSIMMVPRTPEGRLCKILRDSENKLRRLCSNSVKVIEEPGTQIKKLLSGGPWKQPCPRPACNPCSSGESGRCTQRGIVYMSSCSKCTEDNKLTCYIGETNRSLYERSLEHLRDARKLDPDSHILIHQQEAHPNAPTQNLFKFKVMSSYKSSFARQLAEAVEIMTFKGGSF